MPALLASSEGFNSLNGYGLDDGRFQEHSAAICFNSLNGYGLDDPIMFIRPTQLVRFNSLNGYGLDDVFAIIVVSGGNVSTA
ncbi:hypothetical protein THIOKS1870001 [Thiocapsa sp. KS1]|nr:hypothetical protein THIOKS1870001 [Thiocapsa sp. KS1]